MRNLLIQELLLLAGSLIALTTVFWLVGGMALYVATIGGTAYGAIAYVLGIVARLMWKKLGTRRNRRPPMAVVTNRSRTRRQNATVDKSTATGNGPKPEQDRMRWTEQKLGSSRTRESPLPRQT
jgi:hypothetical protein